MKNISFFFAALTIYFGAAHATEAIGNANEKIQATKPLKGVAPNTLKIEDSTTKEEFCANVVEVIEAKQACKKKKCLRPFSYDANDGETLKPGMRAINLASCDPKKPTNDFLIWGPENILLLKLDRKLEKDLWEQKAIKKAKAILFTTEAGTGTLTLKSGKFTWTESE